MKYDGLVQALRELANDKGGSNINMPMLLNRIADVIEELTDTNVGKWIPVTERLPEAEYGESEDVLTIDSLKVMRVAYFDGGNWCYPTGEVISTTCKFHITHWMPLPEPPKEETVRIFLNG